MDPRSDNHFMPGMLGQNTESTLPVTGGMSESQPAPRPSRGTWDAAVFVWGLWAALFVADLGLVAAYGQNVPHVDDWALVPYVAGAAPVTAAYLWEQHNEHRLPLPKLALLALARLSGGDFRAGMYASAALLGALAFLLIRAAQRLRGRLAYSDAFLPLFLLNWGHYETLLWSWEIQYTLAVFLIGLALMFLIEGEARLSFRRGVVFGLALLLLPLCGAQGIPFALTLAVWLGYIAVRRWAAADQVGRRQAAVLLALAVAPCVLVGLYFLDFESRTGSYISVPHPTLEAIVWTTLGFLGTAMGPVCRAFGPLGWCVAVTVGLLSGILLLYAWKRQPAERTRVLGLLLFFAAVGGLALGVGLGRAGDPDARWNGYEPRYFTLLVPAGCAVYFAWSLFARGQVADLARMGLFSLAGSVWMINSAYAVDYGRGRCLGWERKFVQAVEHGEPVYQLARNFARPLAFELPQDDFAERLRMLHRARIGPYRDLKENPPFREEHLAVVPRTVSPGVTWDGQRAWITATGAHLDFSLSQPRYVAGIRLKIRYTDREDGCPRPSQAWKNTFQSEFCPRLQVNWMTTGQADFLEVPWMEFTKPRYQEERYLTSQPVEQTLTIWVADTIRAFRLYPDKPLQSPEAMSRYWQRPTALPFGLVIADITLLTPAKGP